MFYLEVLEVFSLQANWNFPAKFLFLMCCFIPLTRPSRTNTKKYILFIIGYWNAKVGSQEIPGVTGKFGLGVQNEAGECLTEVSEENTLVIANTLFQQHKK